MEKFGPKRYAFNFADVQNQQKYSRRPTCQPHISANCFMLRRLVEAKGPFSHHIIPAILPLLLLQ
jgi:hypothetical protein